MFIAAGIRANASIGGLLKKQEIKMSIQLKRADKKTSDYRKIKRLYKKAFPAEERAPFFLLSVKAKKDCADFWALYDDKKWSGLMYVVN